MSHPVYLTTGARTPISSPHRSSTTAATADELASEALAQLPGPVDLVMLGDTIGPGGNTARKAALGAGLNIPGITLDAQCGTGLVAIAQAAHHVVATGQTVAAGGAESVSRAPTKTLDGQQYRQAPFTPAGHPDPDMTHAADRLAAELGISRERQHAFALESHRRALASPLYRAGQDTGPRTLSPALANRFAPLFTEEFDDATVTALSAASPMDAAAVLTVTSALPDDGTPAFRILGSALTPGDPERPGVAPITAITQVLQQTDRALADVAVIEIVEAYSAIVLATVDGLGISEHDPRLNAWGGALAYGHPWAASGALSTLQCMQRLESDPGAGQTVGLVAAAIAGGLGAALLIERINDGASSGVASHCVSL